MAISPRNVQPAVVCLGVAAVTAGLGAGYSYVTGGSTRYGAVAGFLIGLLLACFELFVVQKQAGAWLRRSPIALFILVSALVWAVLIIFSIFVAAPLALGIERQELALDARAIKAMSFAFVLAFLSTFFLRVRSLVGGRMLFNFVIGRYHQPVREERVFMFLDVADSTRLAEVFGDEKIQTLIGRFFFDIARPIAEHRGETYRYVGDEVVVSWPMARAIEHARCLQCVFDIQALLERRAPEYRRMFGVVPHFRVGMHGGPVIVGEVGDSHRAIVFFGETVSIAVALQGACKRVGQDVLISAALMERLAREGGPAARPLGPVELFADGTCIHACAPARSLAGGQPRGAP